MKNIVIFASGSGSNAENIILYGKKEKKFNVLTVFCNNPNALVIDKAKNRGVETIIFTKIDFNSDTILKKLKHLNPDLIVLAGFLWKFPENIIENFPAKVINIHPALLPKYGGKGMFGGHVHEAVFTNKEEVSGITIHYINKNYDEGAIIFQKQINIVACKSPEAIAKKIHDLEMCYFPEIISNILK